LNIANQPGPTRGGDWAGIYFQVSESNALGTVAYRIEQQYKTAQFLWVDFGFDAETRLLLIRDDAFGSGQCTGEEKANLLRQHPVFQPPLDDRPLMEQLGERRFVVLCRESEGEYEFIVPHALFTSEIVAAERLGLQFRLDQSRFMISGVRKSSEDPFRPFSDAEQTRLTTDSPLPEWLLNIVDN
jgi:hypothetical protein